MCSMHMHVFEKRQKPGLDNFEIERALNLAKFCRFTWLIIVRKRIQVQNWTRYSNGIELNNAFNVSVSIKSIFECCTQ